MTRTVKCLVPALLLGLALAGCATPESKVRSRLIGLGVSPPMAGCMADRMVDRLSYAQLRRLGELGGLAKHDVRDMRVGELRSEEHTSELQSLMRLSYPVFCLTKKIITSKLTSRTTTHTH